MRIGIDCRMLNASGIGRYVTNLLMEIQELDTKNEYFVFVLNKDLKKLNLNSNFKLIEADFYWYSFAEQLKFPSLLLKYKLDIVHFPHFNIPIFYRGKFVVTIHDLTHLDFKMSRSSAHNRLFYEIKHNIHKMVFKLALIKSQKVITVSNFVKSQLESRYDINSKKILVTYEGIDQEVKELVVKVGNKQISDTLAKYRIKKPFIFYVGNAHPHKNIEGLIKAFLMVKKEYQNCMLVLSGKEDFFWERMKKEFNDSSIVYTGFITDLELVVFYKSAEMFVFPSYSEGFGIPLIEAMYCGCPVITSDRTALPEIAGEAAIYFDPSDLNDMRKKIIEVLNDRELQKLLIRKGRKRAEIFNWKKMVRQTLDVYNNFL